MAAKLILLVAIVFLACGKVRGDSLSKFAGSSVTISDAVSKCDAICIAQVTDWRPYSPPLTGINSEHVESVQVNILKILRGNAFQYKAVPIHYIRVDSQRNKTSPRVGNLYIFFINNYANVLRNPYIVLKILPANEDNVAVVKKLVSN